MGNSCAKDSGRSNPGMDATISSPGEQKTFKWTIDGFSSLLDRGEGWTYSSVFESVGVNWYSLDTALVALTTRIAQIDFSLHPA
ncbi:hypothetical protein C2845_PM03G07380 [Panicum miliaceum]|uniref:MATH domain-containing protein n=1 Tax=Panicum miliaceum TaxID=4540 RepID=A0A3L6T7D9_PANMI|nr:hypothetical protein C2845_PM03G07380 [Panicum miliaceum]